MQTTRKIINATAAKIPPAISGIGGVVWRPSAIIIRDRRLVNSVPQGNGTNCGVHACLTDIHTHLCSSFAVMLATCDILISVIATKHTNAIFASGHLYYILLHLLCTFCTFNNIMKAAFLRYISLYLFYHMIYNRCKGVLD